tara:strand:- start:254 stop:391 length:138 start_codon:yes stop_codon:yes gene_type:complete
MGLIVNWWFKSVERLKRKLWKQTCPREKRKQVSLQDVNIKSLIAV